MKTIQGLRKRTGAMSYVRKGAKKIRDVEKLAVGDVAHVFHENGGRASIRVDVVQDEGTFIGTVVQNDGKIPGLAVKDSVVENLDFVFVITPAA